MTPIALAAFALAGIGLVFAVLGVNPRSAAIAAGAYFVSLIFMVPSTILLAVDDRHPGLTIAGAVICGMELSALVLAVLITRDNQKSGRR